MCATIWTRCAGPDHITPLQVTAWRVVESQSHASLRQLTQSDDDRALLERMVEGVKPAYAPPGEFRGLHPLLPTRFRYPPLQYGSRFGSRWERGLWYGAAELETSFAEYAYYRFRFLQDTEADLPVVSQCLTSFAAPINTEQGVHLNETPFDEHREAISDPTSYGVSQPLGTSMREAPIEAFLYWSARADGVCVGVLTPNAFDQPDPFLNSRRGWGCTTTRDTVSFVGEWYASDHPQTVMISKGQFLVDGVLPQPTA